jgi:hypothetical protein
MTPRSARTRVIAVTSTMVLAIIAGGLPESRAALLEGARLLVQLHRATGFDWSIWTIAAGLTLMTMGLLLRVRRRRAHPPFRVRRLAAKGASVAAIARSTGLAQDAVRDLLRDANLAQAAPSAGPRRTGGTLFRRARAAHAPPGPDFAALLRESAARATT